MCSSQGGCDRSSASREEGPARRRRNSCDASLLRVADGVLAASRRADSRGDAARKGDARRSLDAGSSRRSTSSAFGVSALIVLIGRARSPACRPGSDLRPAGLRDRRHDRTPHPARHLGGRAHRPLSGRRRPRSEEGSVRPHPPRRVGGERATDGQPDRPVDDRNRRRGDRRSRLPSRSGEGVASCLRRSLLRRPSSATRADGRAA